MREGAKRRLAGAVVLVTLAVIFIPMLVEERPPTPPVQTTLPPPPELEPPPGPQALHEAQAPLGEPGQLGGGGKEKTQPAVETTMVTGFDNNADLGFEPLQEPVAPTQAPPANQRLPTPSAVQRAAPAAPTKPPAPAQPPAQPPKPATLPPKPATTAKAETAAKIETKPEAGVTLPEPPRSRAPGLPSWVVQVSSLNSPEAAARLADRLKQSGFSAFVERAEVGGKTYYRVRVGPDSDRASAERTAAQLREQHKLDTLIQRYEPAQR